MQMSSYHFCAKPSVAPLPRTSWSAAWWPPVCEGIFIRDGAAGRARAHLGGAAHQIADAGFYPIDAGEPLNAFK